MAADSYSIELSKMVKLENETMKLLLQVFAIVFLFTSSGASQTKARMFEIRVDSKIDNCSKQHKVIVEAKSIIDAREKAQRVVQYKLSTRIISPREINR